MASIISATSAASGAHTAPIPECVKRPGSDLISRVYSYFADPDKPLMIKIAMVVAGALAALALGHLFGAKILTFVFFSTVVVLGGALETCRRIYEAAQRQTSTEWLHLVANDTPPERYLPISADEIAVRTLDLGDREFSSIRPDEVPFTKYGQDRFGRAFLVVPVQEHRSRPQGLVVVYQKHTTGNEWALWCSQNFSSIAFDPHDPAQFFSDLRRQYECGGNRHAFDRALENHAQQQAEQQAQRAERAEGADTDTDEEGSSAATHPQFTGYPGTQGIPPGVTIPHPGPGEYE